MSTGTTLPPNAGEKLLAYTRINNEVHKRMQGERQEKQAAEERRPALIKQAVDSLVTHGRIHEEQRDQVAAALQDHNTALEMLEKLAHHRNATEVEQIGHEVTGPGGRTGQTKQANQGPVGSPVANYDERESGQRFRDRIMGTG